MRRKTVQFSPLRDTASNMLIVWYAPLLHVNRKWTLGKGFANFFSKSSLRAKTPRKTNVFASRHFLRKKDLISGWPASLKDVYYEFSIKFCTGICTFHLTINCLFFPKGSNAGFIRCRDGRRCEDRKTCCYYARLRRYACCNSPFANCCHGSMDGKCCPYFYR